jgi:hypothetical protein
MEPKRLSAEIERKMRSTEWTAEAVTVFPERPSSATQIPPERPSATQIPKPEATKETGRKTREGSRPTNVPAEAARPAIPKVAGTAEDVPSNPMSSAASSEIVAATEGMSRSAGPSSVPPGAGLAQGTDAKPADSATPSEIVAAIVAATKAGTAPAGQPSASPGGTDAAEAAVNSPMRPTPSAEISAIAREVLSAPTPSKGYRLKRLKITASAAAVGGDDSMFAGSLGMVGLADLLEFCRTGQRNGMLFCHLGELSGSVTLRQGKLLYAESPKTEKISLLARLLESGDTSEDQVKELGLSDDDGSDDEAVAQLLVASGFTHPDAIRKAMAARIKDSIEEMIGWVDGTFAFHPTDVEAGKSDAWAIDSDAVLLQIFKEQDDKKKDEEAD